MQIKWTQKYRTRQMKLEKTVWVYQTSLKRTRTDEIDMTVVYAYKNSIYLVTKSHNI